MYFWVHWIISLLFLFEYENWRPGCGLIHFQDTPRPIDGAPFWRSSHGNSAPASSQFLRKIFGDLSNMLPGFMWVSKSWVPMKFQVWQKHTSLSSLIAMNRNKSTQISHPKNSLGTEKFNWLVYVREYLWISMFESMFFPPTWVSGLSFETMHESLPIHLTSLTRSANIMEPCPRNGYGNLMKSGYSGEAELDLPTIVGFDPLSRPHMMFCSKFDRSFKSRCFKSPVGSCRSEFASYTQPQMVPMDPVWPADHGKSLVIRLKFGAGWWVFTEFGQVVGDGWLRVYYIDWSSVSHFRVIFPLYVVEDIEKKVDCC